MKSKHQRAHDLPFDWPDPPLGIVLVEPRIPQNTGAIARLCAATGSRLHLVKPLGFDISAPAVRRAGLDYWDSVDLSVHERYEDAVAGREPARVFLFSTAGRRSLFGQRFRPGDLLVFGSETEGLPQAMLDASPGQVLGIPIRTDHVRSINLASAVTLATYEALRQIQDLDS